MTLLERVQNSRSLDNVCGSDCGTYDCNPYHERSHSMPWRLAAVMTAGIARARRRQLYCHATAGAPLKVSRDISTLKALGLGWPE